MENPVLIFGAKGLGITALEIFESNNNLVYGFLDDDESIHGTEIHAVSVLGNTEDENFTKLIGKKCDAFIAISNAKEKQLLTDLIIETRKVMPVNAIHSKAYVSPFATFEHGNLISAGSYIGANVIIGSHCVINANATLDYNIALSDFVEIGAGSVIGPEVTIEEGAFIGSGVTVVAGVKIGKNARIGAGSVVMNNVKARQTVFGVPAVDVKN